MVNFCDNLEKLLDLIISRGKESEILIGSKVRSKYVAMYYAISRLIVEQELKTMYSRLYYSFFFMQNNIIVLFSL